MAKPVELSDANFKQEVINANTPVLVDFWAVWCGPCKMVAPVVEEIADEYEGKVKVGKLDVDHNRDTAMQYNIRSIPTLLVFKDGDVVETVVGALPKSQIVDKLAKHL